MGQTVKSESWDLFVMGRLKEEVFRFIAQCDPVMRVDLENNFLGF